MRVDKSSGNDRREKERISQNICMEEIFRCRCFSFFLSDTLTYE
ncbi:hypothetical protein CU004_1739 [Enterococcus faecium]|nr:hypothetical protein [Enterococcus faecium]